jgi:hypothetical protein
VGVMRHENVMPGSSGSKRERIDIADRRDGIVCRRHGERIRQRQQDSWGWRVQELTGLTGSLETRPGSPSGRPGSAAR